MNVCRGEGWKRLAQITLRVWGVGRARLVARVLTITPWAVYGGQQSNTMMSVATRTCPTGLIENHYFTKIAFLVHKLPNTLGYSSWTQPVQARRRPTNMM